MSSAKQHRYTVCKGDTLSRIARWHYGAASLWPEIARANGLKGDRIVVGMKLRLPAIARNKVSHRAGSAPSHPSALHEAAVPTPVLRDGQTAPVIPPVPVPLVDSYGIGPAYSSGEVPAIFPLYPTVTREIWLQRVELPQYTIEGKLECEYGLQRKGAMSELEMDEEGIYYKGKLAADYDTAFSKLTANTTVKFDFLHPEKGLSLSSALSLSSKVGGKEFISTSFQPIPPNKFVYKMEPREVESETPDGLFKFKGKVGFTITVTIRNPQPQEETVTVPAAAFAWSKLPLPTATQVTLVCGTILVLTAVTIVAPPAGAAAWAEILEGIGVGARVIGAGAAL